MSDCPICEHIESLTRIIRADKIGYTLEEALVASYVTGFSRGFMLRSDVTYVEYCQKHADLMSAALAEAGAKPVPTGQGGSA